MSDLIYLVHVTFIRVDPAHHTPSEPHLGHQEVRPPQPGVPHLLHQLLVVPARQEGRRVLAHF